MRSWAWAVQMAAACVFLAGCGGEPPVDEEPNDGREIGVIGGRPADGHEEAVYLNGSVWCSGSVIAPRVVLTAGHCVVASSWFEVHAPFAGGQVANSVKVVNYDYEQSGPYVNTSRNDIGLVVLDRDIKLSRYPVVATSGSGPGTLVEAIGRMQNASPNGQMYISDAHPISGVEDRFYWAQEYIQSGDSGGPVILAGSNPPVIIGVNSGAGGGSELVARVDVLASWIGQVVNDNGGGAQAGSDPDVRFTSVHSGRVMDVSNISQNPGAVVWQWGWVGGANQKWKLREVGGGFYQVVSVNSGQCLDVAYASQDDGASLIQWPCHDGGNQRFGFVDTGDGTYAMFNQASGKCVDVKDWGQGDGAELQQWSCHYGANQKWQLHAVQ